MPDDLPPPAATAAGFETGLVRISEFRHGRLLHFRNDTGIGQCLERYGEFGEDEVRAMRQLVRAGDIVVDVGANIGTVAVPLAKRVGPTGTVYAIEAQRLFHSCLSANALLNDLFNLRAIHAAAGDRAGEMEIAAFDVAKEANFGAAKAHAVGPRERVRVLRVDDLDLPACALIKIDVEGMDFAVIRGAYETICRHRPAIYFEAKAGFATRQAIKLLMDLEYRVFWHFCRFVGGRPRRGGAVPPELRHLGDINALALPAEEGRAASLPECLSPDAMWRDDYAAWNAARGAASGPQREAGPDGG